MTIVSRRAVTFGLAATTFVPSWVNAATTKVTFILVNDIYLMAPTTMADGKARGGFARLAAVVKGERAKGGTVIFAHAGDTLSPSLMSGFDRGAHIITLTNMIQPDIFAPGNHEFDFGKATFFERMRDGNFQVFASNLRAPDGSPLPGIKDRDIITVGGVRIGLTGTAYDATPQISSSEDLKFAPTVASTKEQAEALRREGADFVVAVVHAARHQDYELFATRTVDLILTGHDHDLFVEFDGRNAMVESSFDAHFVSVIDVWIDASERDGQREVRWWPQFRIIDTANVVPDPEVAAVVARFEAEFSREMDVALGTTAFELDSRVPTVRAHEAAIGSLIADAMRALAKSDAAVMNGGGIRAGKVYPPGSTITRRDILAELPFDNRVVTIEITGRALREALEVGLSRVPTANGGFPQVSGITIKADPKRPAGARITALTIDGKPAEDERLYTVATNDFLARGGNGYTTFRDAKHLTPDGDGQLLANEVMVYVRRLGTVRSKVDGRIALK